MLLFQETVVPS